MSPMWTWSGPPWERAFADELVRRKRRELTHRWPGMTWVVHAILYPPPALRAARRFVIRFCRPIRSFVMSGCKVVRGPPWYHEDADIPEPCSFEGSVTVPYGESG